MRRRPLAFASLLALGLLALAARERPLGADGPADVFVTNFPAVQRVTGTVQVGAPIPQTRLEKLEALVSPGQRSEPGSYAEAGTLDAAGFAAVNVGITGLVQGRLAAPAPIGLLLLPDVPEIVATFRNHGIAPFALEVEAEAVPSDPGLFHSEQLHFRLGFPRYRVFVYNGGPRTTEVTVYAYLTTT